MNYGLIFLTGLTTGGISCIAVQGGLLASLIAINQAQNSDGKLYGAVTIFLVSKLAAYTMVGVILGLIGSAFQLNLNVMLFFQTLAALYMIATALNLLEVHPMFRYLVIQPPKFAGKWLRHSTKLNEWFGAIVLGILTVLVPCGVTQAMEVSAVASGHALQGGLTLFFFVLGTIPVFAMIGLATAGLSGIWHTRLTQGAATILIIIALISLNGVMTVINSPFSVSGIISKYRELQSYEQGTNPIDNTSGIQKITIKIASTGYSPNYIQVKKGIPVQLTLTAKDSYSCANYFIFKAFNIAARLSPSATQTFTFTPLETGRYTFSCSMGMYTGTMEVL